MPQVSTTGLFQTTFNQHGNFTYDLPSAPGTLATTANVAAETARATAAESAEAIARAAADTAEITARNAAISGETAARTAADALLAPINAPRFSTGVTLWYTLPTLDHSDQAVSSTWVSNFLAASGYAPTGTSPVTSVAGRTGVVTLTHTDITDWAATLATVLLKAGGIMTGPLNMGGYAITGIGSLGGAIRGYEAFLNSTTWTAPANVTQVKSRVWGAGGGGGGVNGAAQSSGGSAGGYSERISTVVPGAIYTITVGAGGPGGPGTPGNGTSGGTSSFDSFHSSTGGGGGMASGSGGQSTTAPAGSGIGGTLNLTGSRGSGSLPNGGGAGGASPLGSSGAPGSSIAGTGSSGQVPGAGGAGTAATTGGQAGGAGGAGLIILEW